MTLFEFYNCLTGRLLRMQKHGFIRVWMARPEEPFQPSLCRRGTTWMWRCGTLWLIRLLTATNEPCSQSPFQRTGKELGNGKERREPCLWEINQRRIVLFGNDQTVSRKERAAVQKKPTSPHSQTQSDFRA